MENAMATREQERELTAWIIRKFPEGKLPADQAQYLIEHPEELPALLLAMVARNATPATLQAAVSEWQKLFGHLAIWDGNFNEKNFPLVDDGDEAEEVGLDKLVTGHQALEEFTRMKREGASLGAQGRYIKAHPKAQKEHPLLGIGARWQHGGFVWFPIFDSDDLRPNVRLGTQGPECDARCRFLLRKAKRA